MRSITLSVPEKGYDFFIKLISQVDFVTINAGKSSGKAKKEFPEGLSDAVKEVNLAKEGKIKLKSAQQLLHEL